MGYTQSELLIRLPEVMQRVGMSKSQIYKLAGASEFPRPVKVSERISCWVAAEIEEWVSNKIQGRDKPAEREEWISKMYQEPYEGDYEEEDFEEEDIPSFPLSQNGIGNRDERKA